MKKLLITVISVVGIVTAATAGAQEITFKEYTVKKGDTCTSIAKAFYGDPHAYDNIHKYNDLSANDYACTEGTTLKIPIFPAKPEAQLTARYGKVRAKSPTINWKNVDVGEPLYQAWRVNTLEESSAELGFNNDSKLQMSENTLVVIYGPDKNSAAISSAGRATVERGRLRTFLNDLAGQPLVVETPSANATITSGSQQITVDESQESRFANHDGDPVDVSTPDGKAKVVVEKGFGSRVKKNQPPEKPRKLPVAPTWSSDIDTYALTLENGKADLKAHWEPVPGAEEYRVELSKDKRQLDLVFSKNVPNNITNVELKDLPVGVYYLSVVSIDDQKFESTPSEILKLEVLPIRTPKSQVVVENDEAKVVLGTQIFPAKETTCVIEGDDSGELIIKAPQSSTVICEGRGKKLSYTFNVITPKLQKNEPITVPEGRTATTLLTFVPVVPAALKIDAPQGLAVKYIKKSERELQFSVGTKDIPPGDYKFNISVYDHIVGSVDVKVVEVLQEPQQLVNLYPRPYVDVMLGYDAMISLDAGHPFGGTLELGLGIQANNYFAAELRAGYGYYAPPKSPASIDQPDHILSARLQAMIGWFPKPISIYGIVGGVWRGFLRDPFENRIYATGGFGVMPYITSDVGIRVEADLAVGSVDFKFDYLPEVRVGIQYIF